MQEPEPDAAWVRWLREQSPWNRLVIAENAITRLIELDEVHADDEEGGKLYWADSGEGLDVPF